MNIIGQEKTLAEINRIFDIFKNSNQTIKPHFILTGKSGSGKSLIIQSLAAQFEFNFLEVNSAQLTKEGIAGNSLTKALSGLREFADKPTVVFFDEWDKLFIQGNSNSNKAMDTTTEVQNEFLKMLEGTTTSIFGQYGHYDSISTQKVLFVFAGAFNNEENISIDRLREIGVKTEFLGRVGLLFNTEDLNLEHLYTVLEQSNLLKLYVNLFECDKTVVENDLKQYVAANYEMNTLGARMVNTLIHQYFIKGGKLAEEVTQAVTFQTKLSL